MGATPSGRTGLARAEVHCRSLAAAYLRDPRLLQRELSTFLQTDLPAAGRMPHATQPLVSIVMPCFNAARFVERSIRSVLLQDLAGVELIVVDGGSTDGSVPILERYAPYLAHWVSEPDRGQSDALNKGFALARGEIFGWLNADDLLLPGALRSVRAAFAEAPSHKTVVFGDWLEIHGDDTFKEYCPVFDFSTRQLMYEGFAIHPQAAFWKRAVHERFGRFDLSLHKAMDYDMFLRFGLAEGDQAFLRLARPLACFRRHPDQKTQDGPSPLAQAEHRHIAAKLGCERKFARSGRAVRLLYRFRRALWYWRRLGPAQVWRKGRPWLKRNAAGLWHVLAPCDKTQRPSVAPELPGGQRLPAPERRQSYPSGVIASAQAASIRRAEPGSSSCRQPPAAPRRTNGCAGS
jgi:glycosyltransferase involved in cell wall biosynthesis